MAKNKKNSNYVTDKTVEKKAAEDKQKKAAKTKKQAKSIAVTSLITLVVLAALFSVLYFGGAFDYNPTATEHVSIALDGYSTTLHVELYGKDAPQSTGHFKSLVNGHYYNGKMITEYSDGNLYFGEAAAGKGGVKGEFADNGVKNKIPFKVGTLVMARGEEYDSAYGRFFIVTEDTDISSLKGSYAAFGRVTSGMEVIEEIIGKLNLDQNGKIPEAEQIKITSISAHDSH